ncbi:MAG: sugar phosphate nucleotidyltransferase [Actinomycetota bacterium]
MITTLILCGGRGTRAYPHTLELPKPLLDVAGRPILHHVMEIYATQGHERFVLAGGYKVELIDQFASELPSSWDVTVIDTGLDTNKGERVLKCREHLGERFFVTYGDGVGNIDLARLTAHHDHHGGSATVTVVPLPSQFGTLTFGDDGGVVSFQEKPRIEGHWINAGFFVMDEGVFDHWEGDDLERDVCPALAKAGELFAYEHDGFWKWMDTFKEAMELSGVAESEVAEHGRPPWLR